MVHGIQLAVVDVLYKYQFPKSFSVVPSTIESDSESDNDYQNEDALNYIIDQPQESERPEFIYKNLIDSVRTFFNDDDDDCDIFAKPTSDEIHQTIVNLLKRLNYNNEKSNTQGGSMAIVTEEPSTSMSSINTSVEDEDDSFHKQLDKEISKASKPPKIATSAIATDLESIIRVEMCVFETGGGGREVFLSAAYKYLQSVTEKL
ncbi:hypothetical protein ACJJTC_016815 [Scirpophaga incertulas]